MGAIYIMWKRQLKKYWRSKPRIVAMLGQPLLFLLALGFGLNPVFEQAGLGNYIQFLVPGIVAMTILFTAMFSGIEIIWERQFGFLKETLVAPVSRFKIMLGKTLGGATVATIQGMLVFIVSLLIGYRPQSLTLLPTALAFMFIIAVFFTALGLAIASQLNDMQAFPLVMNFIIMPIFFLSGALFPLQGLPTALIAITTINPLTYGVEGLRYSLNTTSQIAPLLSFVVIALFTLAVLWIGSKMFERIQV